MAPGARCQAKRDRSRLTPKADSRFSRLAAKTLSKPESALLRSWKSVRNGQVACAERSPAVTLTPWFRQTPRLMMCHPLQRSLE